jgi:hypothetical protein
MLINISGSFLRMNLLAYRFPNLILALRTFIEDVKSRLTHGILFYFSFSLEGIQVDRLHSPIWVRFQSLFVPILLRYDSYRCSSGWEEMRRRE